MVVIVPRDDGNPAGQRSDVWALTDTVFQNDLEGHRGVAGRPDPPRPHAAEHAEDVHDGLIDPAPRGPPREGAAIEFRQRKPLWRRRLYCDFWFSSGTYRCRRTEVT